MFNKFLKINFILFFLSTASFAEVINKIEISGNERISDETVLVLSGLKLGSQYSQSKLNESLKNLYDTNFFKTINLEFKNGTLNINIFENPIIQSVIIKGIKKQGLEDALYSELNLKDRSSYVEFLVRKDQNKILNILKTSGYYLVDIKTEITNNSNNTIDLIYNISLGDKAVISNIKFIGNKVFKDRILKNIIVSEKNYFWKFISKDKYVNTTRINFDKKLLTNFYKNRGYYKVKVQHSTAKFLDKNNFDLIFSIDAGPKFFFNDINLILPPEFDKDNFEDLNSRLASLSGKTYTYNQIEKILKEVDKITATKQYQFINAKVNESIVSTNKINFDIIIDNIESLYVKKINIKGNDVTKEEVIRNELIIDEGDPFNEILFNKSINQIKSLNFFKSVKFEVLDTEIDNTKIINITVEEKATGEISLGAGVGTSGGTVGFSLKENNYMGKGIGLSTSLTLSEQELRGLFSVNNPNFINGNKDLITVIESTEIDKMKNFGYKTNKIGFSIGTRYEQFEDIYFSPSVSTYYEDLTTSSSASQSLKKQTGDYFDINFLYGLELDKRNARYRPTNGYKSKFTQTLPLVTDEQTVVNGYDFKIYTEIIDKMIGSFSLFLKSANSLNGDVKVSDRLFMPERKLRGFEAGRVGPLDGDDFIGGNYLAAATISTNIPQVFKGLDNTDLSIFFDAANIWEVDYNVDLHDSSKIRTSFGIAIDWFTPIGPLSLSLTEVISKKSTDMSEKFRFNLGTTF